MAEGCSGDHNPIHSVAVERLFCFLRGVDVAVANYRNMHPRVPFDLSDEGPVGLALVHLASGPPVDRESLDARILKPFGQLHDNLAAFVPAETGLDRDRLANGLDDPFCNHHHLVRILHHT